MTTPTSGQHSMPPLPPATFLPKGAEAGRFTADRTALLVIDPVNDFLSEGGAAWEMTKTTVQKNDVIANLRRAIEGARQRGVPVLFGPMAYTEADYAEMELHRRSGINRIMFEKKMFLAGSWGADFHPDLRPLPQEIVLLPHKSCDVFETDLTQQLQRLGTMHLVIAGMTANLCCESTGRRGVEKGYDVTYLSDAIGAENMMAYEAAIRVNYPLMGNAVMTVDQFLATVDATRQGQLDVRAGDKVFSSDDLEIGTVEQVAEATAETGAYILVPRGLIFSKETYIPLDAVMKRGADGAVYVNMPKLVLSQMPWDRPPTHAMRREKLGPRATEVEKLYGSRSPSVLEQGQKPTP